MLHGIYSKTVDLTQDGGKAGAEKGRKRFARGEQREVLKRNKALDITSAQLKVTP